MTEKRDKRNEKDASIRDITTRGNVLFQPDQLARNFGQNLIRLINLNGMTQKDFALKHNIPESTLSGYINGNHLPSFSFLSLLINEYNISLDSFFLSCSRDYSSENVFELAELASRRKFIGTYIVYYLNSCGYIGQNKETQDEALRYGLLSILPVQEKASNSNLSCFAYFGIKTKGEVDALYWRKNHVGKQLKESAVINEYEEKEIEMENRLYKGTVSFTNFNFFIEYENSAYNKGMAIFKRPPVQKPHYLGGLGAMVSVPTDGQSIPACQFLALSRYPLCISEEEIHYNLLLNHPNINAKEETDFIIQEFKKIYMGPESAFDKRSEYQKSLTIQINIERYMNEWVNNSLYRFGKFSIYNEDEWYRLLKRSSRETEDN